MFPEVAATGWPIEIPCPRDVVLWLRGEDRSWRPLMALRQILTDHREEEAILKLTRRAAAEHLEGVTPADVVWMKDLVGRALELEPISVVARIRAVDEFLSDN
jgi:hypothetical protein